MTKNELENPQNNFQRNTSNKQLIFQQNNLEDLFQQFIIFIDATPNTVRTYRGSLKQWFLYLRQNQIGHPDSETVRQYRQELQNSGKKPTTVKNYIIAVKRFFEWTEEAGFYPNIAKYIKNADLFISTVLIPGARPPKLVTEKMVKSMKPGSVIVDVAIDQGGTVETIDHPTTIEDPVFVKDGIIHYAVPNQPGAVPRTATLALASGNISYLLEIVEKGLDQAIKDDEALMSGINIYQGKVTNKGLADSLNYDFTEIDAI